MFLRPKPFSVKSLLCIGIFCAVIQPGAIDAWAGESPDTLTTAQLVVPPPDAPVPETGIPLIPPAMSVDEFTRHMQGAQEAALTLDGFVALQKASPDLIVLDVRAKERFAGRHIKGSLNLPVTEMTEHTLPLLIPDKARTVVLVCDESFFPTRRLSMTLQAWPVLTSNGYTNLHRLNLWRPEQDGGPAHTPEQIEQHVTFDGIPPPAAP